MQRHQPCAPVCRNATQWLCSTCIFTSRVQVSVTNPSDALFLVCRCAHNRMKGATHMNQISSRYAPCEGGGVQSGATDSTTCKKNFLFGTISSFLKRVLSDGWVPGQAGFTFCPTGGGEEGTPRHPRGLREQGGLYCVMNGYCWAKGGDFSGKNFQTRLNRPLQSNVLSEAVSAPVVDHWSHRASGVGSIAGTMLNSSGTMAQEKKKILSIFSQLMMKVLKVLGHPRRGVPASPPPL